MQIAIAFVSISALFSSAVAFPKAPHSINFFIPPHKTDGRTPCPGLNVLANEGVLPHNGHNITPAIIKQALQDGYNFDVAFADMLSQATLPFLNEAGTFDLHDLAKHGIIEHDASLVHDDVAPGQVFGSVITNQTKVAAVAALSSDGKVLTEHDVARARIAAEAQARPISQEIQINAAGEPALVVTVFGRKVGEEMVLDLDAFKSVFGENRFPKGFRRPAQIITGQDVGAVASRIFADKQEIEAGAGAGQA